MADPSVRDCEKNEVDWWSHWANVRWFGTDAWLIESDLFDEYFMNRGGFIQCDHSDQNVARMEPFFARRGLAPHFFVQEGCTEIIQRMAAAGYRVVDSMYVMTPDHVSIVANTDVKVEVASEAGIGDWSRVYLESFYGELKLKDAVTSVTNSLITGVGESTLVLGRLQGEPAGVLALHRTSGLLGIYCIGTLQQFRGRAVAATLIDAALRKGREEGRQVVLQTIASDGYESYYKARGFRRLYSKSLLKKDLPPAQS